MQQKNQKLLDFYVISLGNTKNEGVVWLYPNATKSAYQYLKSFFHTLI